MARRLKWIVGTVMATVLSVGLVGPASATPVVLFQSDQLQVTGDLRWIGTNYQIDYSFKNVTLDLLQVDCTWTGTLGNGTTFPSHMSYPIPGGQSWNLGAGGDSVLPGDMACTATVLATPAEPVVMRFPPLRVTLTENGAGSDETILTVKNMSHRKTVRAVSCRWSGGHDAYGTLAPLKSRSRLHSGVPSTITNLFCKFRKS